MILIRSINIYTWIQASLESKDQQKSDSLYIASLDRLCGRLSCSDSYRINPHIFPRSKVKSVGYIIIFKRKNTNILWFNKLIWCIFSSIRFSYVWNKNYWKRDQNFRRSNIIEYISNLNLIDFNNLSPTWIQFQNYFIKADAKASTELSNKLSILNLANQYKKQDLIDNPNKKQVNAVDKLKKKN